jgi:signal transduction histidine kinase
MPDPKVNILLVDDRPENLLALEAVLSDLGQNLVTAGSGSEALKRLLHDDFAVILLDVQMPEMDGFETAALIRSRARSQYTPLIFLTAINKSDTHVSRGYAMGAVDYVFKPFAPETLKSKVAAFVELSKKTKELQAEVVQRRRAEEEAIRLNEELERRVSERTAALSAANRELENEIAERKQLETALHQRAEELAEADRRKDEFLAMLAHELRNPLAPIGNAVKVLQLAGSADPVLMRARAILDRQVRHMSRLVDDLLDVSRITRGLIQLDPEPLDLVALTEQAVEMARPALDGRQHQLTLTLPPEPLWVEADPIRLEQVVANLLNNAIKYTEPEGRIWVHLAVESEGARGRGGDGATGRQGDEGSPDLGSSHHAGSLPRPAVPSPPRPLAPSPPPPVAVLRVRDTGIGMSPEMLPRVFDLFAQADRSLDRSQGGLGLGLTLVRRLVEMHGGSVAARSDGPGRGSEFLVRLPVIQGSGVRGQGSERQGSGVRGQGSERQGSGVRGQGSGKTEASAPELTPDPSPLTPGAQRLTPDPSPLTPGAQRLTPAVRVLVVDDNVDAAAMLAELTELWGCETQVAHDGPAAIEAARAYQPEVVLLDIGLPGMDGYELARRLREQGGLKGALLVAVTGYGQEEDRRRSRAATLDDHLTKPVDPEALRQLVTGAREARPLRSRG